MNREKLKFDSILPTTFLRGRMELHQSFERFDWISNYTLRSKDFILNSYAVLYISLHEIVA